MKSTPGIVRPVSTAAAFFAILTSPSLAQLSIGEALDAPELTWSVSYPDAWVAALSTEAHDGVDSLQRPDDQRPDDRLPAWVETTVTGPGALSFWWHMDTLHGRLPGFAVDGEIREMQGPNGWRRESIQIEPGKHVLRWAFSDPGELDEVRFIRAVPTDLAEGLDNTSLGFFASYDGSWALVDDAEAEGGDALRSVRGEPPYTDSLVSAKVMGPGVVSFRWRNSGGTLGFFTNESVQSSKSTEWTQVIAPMPRGWQRLGWVFRPPTNPTLAASAVGWLDNVSYVRDASDPAALALDLKNQEIFSGVETTWVAQSDVTRDGEDALMGRVEQEIQQTVMGPGVLTFWARVEGSLDQRLRLQGFNNSVLWESSSIKDQWVEGRAFLAAGAHDLSWFVTRDPDRPTDPVNRFYLDQMSVEPFIDLAEALDSSLPFTTGGVERWLGVSDGESGLDHARTETRGGASWVECQVTGPVNLSYSSKLNSGMLSLSVDDFERFSDMPHDWQVAELSLAAGLHRVRWTFMGGLPEGYAELDAVTLKPLSTSLTEGLELPEDSTADNVGGSPGWVRQTNVTHDGIDALAFGPSPQDGRLDVNLTLDQPAVIRVWTKVATGRLAIWIDGFGAWGQYGASDWTLVEIPIASAGPHRISIQAFTTDLDPIAESWIDDLSIEPEVSLAEAVEFPGIATGGQGGGWTGFSSNAASDHVDMAVAPAIPAGSESWLEIAVVGPGDLSFNWQTPDELELLVDGSKFATLIPGAWQRYSVSLAPGAHEVRWVYKGSSNLTPMTYLDELRFDPPGVSLPSVFGLKNPVQMSDSWKLALDGARDGGASLDFRGRDMASYEYLELVTPGPGTVSFWWRGQPQTQYNIVLWGNLFSSDPSGEWTHVEVLIPGGTPTIRIEPQDRAPAVHFSIDALHYQQTVSLAQALDSPLPFVADGDAYGYVSTNAGDGIDYVSTAAFATVSTRVTGPGNLAFRWRGEAMQVVIDDVPRLLGTTTPPPFRSRAAWRSISLPLGDGPHQITWQSAGWTFGLDQVDFTTESPLAEALDLTGQAVITAVGESLWVAQSTMTHDGFDAVECAGAERPGAAPEISLQLAIDLPENGVLSFWWRIQGTIPGDAEAIVFRGAGVNALLDSKNDADTWLRFETAVTAGPQNLSWSFVSHSGPGGRAWIDQVSLFTGPMTYDRWTESHGLPGAEALADADPNKDGISNLEAYAMGLPATGPVRTGLPQAILDGQDPSRSRFQFQRRKNSGFVVTPWFSENLLDWATSGNSVKQDLGNGLESIIVTLDRSDAQFMRLEVKKNIFGIIR